MAQTVEHSQTSQTYLLLHDIPGLGACGYVLPSFWSASPSTPGGGGREDALLGRERSGRNHVEQHGGRSGGLPAGQYILHNYLNLLHKLKESFSDSWTHHELCEDSNYDISATNSEAFRRHKRTAQM